MKLMRYVGASDDLKDHRFYVVDRPTMLGCVRARYVNAPADAWYDYHADDFEEIEQEAM